MTHKMLSIHSVVVAILALCVSPTRAFMPSSTRQAASRRSFLSMSSALIVQNKGGGHGELGFQLAKKLKDTKITSITILQDSACNEKKEPFKSYATDIPDVKIIKADLADESMTAESLQTILGEGSSFEYVWDNASKAPVGAGKAMCDLAKVWGTKLYTYVSSAGIYKPDGTFPMTETTPVKSSAGQTQFDNYAVEIGLPLVSFRPQYIYGPKSNKFDYIDWYFDRLVRGLPLPIPEDGKQKVSLTNSEDVASLLAAVLNNEQAAVEQRFFNCGTDQLHTYDEVAFLCAEAANMSKDDVMIEHYDSDLFGKAYFPFRMTDFYVTPDTAKAKLDWKGPTHNLKDDLKWYFENYKARGGPEKKMELGKDWEIVVGSKTSFDLGSVYDKYDPLIIDFSDVQPLGGKSE